eukprot:gnl/Hemi2/24420_TR8210_c0_g1_i1.p1 gnl/Hemi2/24420_TR8210_c0_g1~~gnl/Hemi2/24420_TR8210_c0_g1_i1.p1  ORF type:complete len:374 (-),score=134.79 gnl/Hemi2/24420_TR8210_c0_g1_i1:117-1238(-)
MELPEPLVHRAVPFGMDIGGTLAKILYREDDFFPTDVTQFFDSKYVTHFIDDHDDEPLALTCSLGKLRFVMFETRLMDQFLSHVLENNLHQSFGRDRVIHVTGGGSYKFEQMFRERLDLAVIKKDEMQCLVRGLNYALFHFGDEVFTLDPATPAAEGAGGADVAQAMQAPRRMVPLPPDGTVYPYLFVNIGSGVSILRIDGATAFQRVSGSPLGGATFWGLFRLITHCEDFKSALDMASRGDNRQADMLVGDIYGDHDYSSIGLSKDIIASCFGKLVMMSPEAVRNIRQEDIALALLKMIAFNIGQIAYLNAVRYNVKRVFFAGNFIQNNTTTMRSLSFATDYYSQGAIQALFLRHEGFFGALGAFLEQEVCR